MSDFDVWFNVKMIKVGYEQTYINSERDTTWINFRLKPNVFRMGGATTQFHVTYIKHPIEAEQIKLLFNSHSDPILFVVDSSLIDGRTINFDMLRALHALYKGRIYTWDGVGLIGVHHDRQAGVTSNSGYIDLDVVRFEQTDCWLKSFPGQFYVAKFNDPPFWMDGAKKRQQAKKEPPKQKQPNENEQYWRQQYQKYSTANDQPSLSDKWFNQMVAAGSKNGAKVAYRVLAKEHHPDFNKAPEALETMKAINVAYEKVMEYYED